MEFRDHRRSRRLLPMFSYSFQSIDFSLYQGFFNDSECVTILCSLDRTMNRVAASSACVDGYTMFTPEFDNSSKRVVIVARKSMVFFDLVLENLRLAISRCP